MRCCLKFCPKRGIVEGIELLRACLCCLKMLSRQHTNNHTQFTSASFIFEHSWCVWWVILFYCRMYLRELAARSPVLLRKQINVFLTDNFERSPVFHPMINFLKIGAWECMRAVAANQKPDLAWRFCAAANSFTVWYQTTVDTFWCVRANWASHASIFWVDAPV